MDHILKCHDIVKTDFVRGDNCSLYDSQGRRYVDLESGIWSTALGHGQPQIRRALHEQIDRIIHLGTRYPSDLTEVAAVDVLQVLEIDDGKCTFLSSGSEAVEFSTQAAARVTGRNLLVSFATSYLAAYGSAGRKPADQWCLIDWMAGDLDAQLARIPFERVAAFVFEPGGSGSGFVRFPPAPWVAEIARRVRAAGGLLVANEVTAGMGRTGMWFGFQHYGVSPDLVALGKGLGNGYPVSAVAMRRDVAERLEASGLHYAQSHQNDPLGCYVASRVISVMREGRWVERGAAVGAALLGQLQNLAARHAVVREARGRGMLLGLELEPQEHLTVEALYFRLLDRGFLTGYYPAGRVLRLDPALTVDVADLDAFVAALDDTLAA